jgi:SNF2 family DNA or RNA helicase
MGEGSVFLISLKAGGTGLNLTGADIVIHFDPWWNPAVENQATDRAHRIGQSKTVEVIKLVARETIEERIIDLQEKKKLMVDNIINNKAGDESLFSEMTMEEIKELFK